MTRKFVLATLLAFAATPAFAQHRGQVYPPKAEQTVNKTDSTTPATTQDAKKQGRAACHCPCMHT